MPTCVFPVRGRPISIPNNALIFYHTYTIESKKKSVYFTDFSIKTSFSLEYRDRFERLLGLNVVKRDRDLAEALGFPGLFDSAENVAKLLSGSHLAATLKK